MWISIALTACSFVGAANDAPPVVTAKTAKDHLGQVAIVESAVVEVKFAQRRQLHFLSFTSNFRSDDNVPVAIRSKDLSRFQDAGIKDLSAHYLGKTIRARGIVTRDEDQWLLVVASPRQIEVEGGSNESASKSELVVVNEKGKRVAHSLASVAALPRNKVTAEHDGKSETYEGVLLADLLKQSDVVMGAEARGNLLGRYVLIKARDGYSAVFSLAEIDPYFAERPALLSDRLSNGSLPTNRAPLQVVVPGDKHRRRWVGQVISIEVRNALDKPAAAQP